MGIVTKAEILWTRQCSLNCGYCNMASGVPNTRTLRDWKKCIDELNTLECQFIALYGAEPLMDFSNLPQIVGYSEELGISTTVITSGVVPNFKEKLNILHSFGAKSISMSYDIDSEDKSSILKSSKCVDGLLYFKSLGNIRDVAAIATVTLRNHKFIPNMIKKMSEKGIWTFFDLIHPDLHHPGSKCKGENRDLLFMSNADRESLVVILDRVLTMKKEGFLCHTTENFVNTLKSLEKDMYSWCCADYKEFPSWVTINCDGLVYPCDDFYTENTAIQFDMTQISKNWEAFSIYWEGEIKRNKCSCCWNTHIDSHGVKKGSVSINDYVHGDNQCG